MCLPRFDSDSVFGALLDDDAGHWSINPAEPWTSSRRYLEGTMVLETTFTTTRGAVTLTDALDLGERTGPHDLGHHAPHTLLRSVTCVRGTVTVISTCKPRPEYGLVVPVFLADRHGANASGGAGGLSVSTPAAGSHHNGIMQVTVTLNEGQSCQFAAQLSRFGDRLSPTLRQQDIIAQLRRTMEGWLEWSAVHGTYTGPWKELVHHSGRVLHALTYQPTGAVIAAPTTSLPEEVGGQRNWDYRYSWVRDASFTMQALWIAACPDEAQDFFTFMETAAAYSRTDTPMQIMFGIGGEHDLSERTLPHLSGWRDSSPVRVGNDAWGQPQLDVYGELLDAAFLLREQITPLRPATRNFLVALANAASEQWRKPDNGIWEIRGQPRHFLYSKLMCWVALDRALRMSDELLAEDRKPVWAQNAKDIRDAILRDGWNAEVGAFTQSFGSAQLDAAALMIPLVGFLPSTDSRVLSTLEVISRDLTDASGLVLRYRTNAEIEGVPGDEGTFLLCSFWLVQAFAETDQLDRARDLFVTATSYANDVGLLAEEVDSRTGEQIGNFPQAFSHIGLVNAAWAIDQAEKRRTGTHPSATRGTTGGAS
ncbi:glycoside hydrolase family 15 [Subtercola boreus]|uniref:Glycoside hydrolase family 15 n=2 Tax=Subtercola boreus TaxID=120213 RepID=A0A3E0VR46_9MICO|nr:glycoside hydrolase family 15 [Subtercola boreus]